MSVSPKISDAQKQHVWRNGPLRIQRKNSTSSLEKWLRLVQGLRKEKLDFGDVFGAGWPKNRPFTESARKNKWRDLQPWSQRCVELCNRFLPVGLVSTKFRYNFN